MLFIYSTSISSQKGINYSHKAIVKEIDKKWGLGIDVLHELNINSFQGKFFSLKDNKNSFIYIGRVNSCRAGGCAIQSNTDEPSEYFDYFIFFNADANVELVKVFNYAATHGHEVMAKGWLKQFSGHNSNNSLEVGKNIDAISGATISVQALTKDIKEKTELLHQHIQAKL